MFDLDHEYTVPAYWSFALLLGTSAAALFAFIRRTPVGARSTSLVLAVLFAFAAFDELFMLHERLEVRTGNDWQVLYVPVLLLGAITSFLWLRAQGGWRDVTDSSLLFLLGGAAWVTAWLLEAFQWSGDEMQPGYIFMMIPEEVAESLGACAFLLAMLTCARAAPPAGGTADRPERARGS